MIRSEVIKALFQCSISSLLGYVDVVEQLDRILKDDTFALFGK